MSTLISSIAGFFFHYGYVGIFVMMFLESSFVPFPSEIVMTPAGFLSATGKFNLEFSILTGVAGSVAGAILNYAIALKLGRPFLVKYGYYVGLRLKHLKKSEQFFEKYGSLGTFVGRLLPVIRQYISIPAGISRMSIVKFIIATAIGSGIWVSFLSILGYEVGANWEIVVSNLHKISIFLTLLLIAAIVVFFFVRLRKKHNNTA